MSAAEAIPIRLPGFDHRVERAKPCGHCQGLGVLTATDIFCGAGGSSLGLTYVCCPSCGRQLIEVTQAINHWDLAVQAHNANFPDADHDVHDVEVIPASRFRRTDILWASPECVNHTSCKGKREDSPEALRSRATFKDIVRFTAYHHYDAVLVENVVEARLWCEHENCGCGAEFDAWYRAMLEEGYDGQIVYFNSQFALPTPQSRDRMYVVFWRRGVPRPQLDFRPMSWCSSCETIVRGIQTWKPPSRGSARELIHEWGRYGAQYLYLCPNEGCGQPVAPAVIGARSIIDFSLPITRIADKPAKACSTCGTSHPVACNTRRRIRVGYHNVGRRVPVSVQVGGHLFEREGYASVWSLDEPLRTVTTTNYTALVTPERSGNVPRPVDQPTPAVAGRAQLGLVLRLGGQAPSGRSSEEPMSTITAHDRQIGLVLQNMEHNQARSADEPTPPVTTGGNHMLVQVNRGGQGGRRAFALDEPHPTVAGHGEVGIVEFRGKHGSVRDGEEPMHTVAAQGTHHGVLLYNGVPGFVRSLGDATGTVTARDKQSLLIPYFRTGAARTREEPAKTVPTHDREALVLTEEDINDCYLRMLQWPELLRAQAMAFHPDGTPYELTARRRNKRGRTVELSNELRTKMIGNAVSSPVATMLATAVAEVLLWPDTRPEEQALRWAA
jgi:DNA (cytosine-5)-methyltransferase 1